VNEIKARILIVDDEKAIVRALQRSLVAQGYNVFTAPNGEKALEAIELHRPDLLLLDLGLPDMGGLEVCQRVRLQSLQLPIIVISVKEAERDKIAALDLGADDYVAKPFSLDEVLARIRVALRHAALMISETEPSICIGPLNVNLAQRFVALHGQEVKLTPTEYDLLKIFLKHRGKIMTQQMLLTQMWGAGDGKDAHHLHVYIGQLRRKIEPDPLRPRLIVTIPGVGYRFSVDGKVS
jgi:two-component system, OmpR family, KDP operon response regulator KdpE